MGVGRLLLNRAGFLSVLFGCCLILLLGGGCSSDAEPVVVDFSQTVPAARPGRTPAGNSPLRVAVARGLVDGVAVDGLIWEYYQEKNPAFTSRTRLIKKSEPYGIPPLVASAHLSQAEKDGLQEVLAGMHQDPEGRKILAGLLIERFIFLKEEWYEPIRAMHQHLARFKGTPHATQKP